MLLKRERIESKQFDGFLADVTRQVMAAMKTKAQLEDVYFVQALSHLKASGYKVGLLINFGSKQVEVRWLAGPEQGSAIHAPLA